MHCTTMNKLHRFNATTGTFTCERNNNNNNCATTTTTTTKTKTTKTTNEYKPSGSMPAFSNRLYDTLLFIPMCHVHHKVLLKPCRKSYFLPFYPFKVCDSWSAQIDYHLDKFFQSINPSMKLDKIRANIIQVNQVRMPKYADHVQQIVMLIDFGADCAAHCSDANTEYKWFGIDQLTASSAAIGGAKSAEQTRFLLGPEPFLYLNRPNYAARCQELSIEHEVKQHTGKWNLIKSLNCTEDDLASLFGEFVQHCYPSLYMNRPAFAAYITKAKLSIEVRSAVHTETRLFASLCVANNAYITFKDLAVGMCVMQARCGHGGIFGEYRTRAIFRYYCADSDDQSSKAAVDAKPEPPMMMAMKQTELTQMFADIIANSKRIPVGLEDKDASKAAKDLLKKQGGKATAAAAAGKKTPEQKATQVVDGITEETFLSLVGSMRIRGTACLYRVPRSPIEELRGKRAYDNLIMREANVEKLFAAAEAEAKPKTELGADKKQQQPFVKRKLRRCDQCGPQNYHLAIHSIKYPSSASSGMICHNIKCTQELPSELTIKYTRAQREKSIASFNAKDANMELCNTLRQYGSSLFGFPKIATPAAPVTNGKTTSTIATPALNWEKLSDRTALIERIFKLCLDAKEAIRKLPRVIKCTSPMYVFGDVHGNFRDLMVFDRLFWRRLPSKGYVCNSLFLGDYVDRGDNSLECILYLLCIRELRPDKVHLLRGNHEVRSIQVMFTFQRECVDKFGAKLGRNLWEAINQVFDVMPLCAIIDEKIFAAHGGIPASSTHVESLFDIPVPLPNPQLWKVAWEILWNDPVSQAEYREQYNPKQDCFPTYPPGFAPNAKRGTAYYYSEDAVNYFQDLNDLSFLIRAHEVVPPGYQFAMDGKMMTVFSCADYCGSGNEAAIVYVEHHKMRVIKVDTNTCN